MSEENNQPKVETNSTPTKELEAGNQGQQTATKEVKEQEKPLALFSRKNSIKSVPVEITLPHIYPGFQPWKFQLALALSSTIEDKREEFLSLSIAEQGVGADAQALDEICDLMRELPTGFGDMTQDKTRKPGEVFREYYNASDEDTQKTLRIIVRGAMNTYWNKIAPYSFR